MEKARPDMKARMSIVSLQSRVTTVATTEPKVIHAESTS